MQEYMKALQELMLQIPSFSERDVLFQFMDGLKPWAK